MFDKIKGLLLTKNSNNTNVNTSTPSTEDKKRVDVAICALLIEIANYDDDFDVKEKEVILNLIKDKFSFTSEEAEELMAIADKKIDESIDIWHFTDLINQHFDKTEKIQILKMFWEVVFADGTLHGNEDYLIHKLAKLIKLDHKDLINAKLSIKSKSQL